MILQLKSKRAYVQGYFVGLYSISLFFFLCEQATLSELSKALNEPDV